MSPALDWAERLRRTERFISFIRLAVVLFNSILYLWLSPTQTRHGLAWTIIIVANLYAVITVFWDPAELNPHVVPAVNMVLDNLLIALWLYATGGYDSPFFMLFYAEAAATIGRFGWKIGTGAAAGSGALYLAVVAIDGGGPAYQVASRIAYIFVIVAFVAYVVENARAAERDALAAEASVEAYAEVSRLKSAFVSTVSHELRTPLTTIKGATTTLLKNQDRFEPDQVRALLQMVERQSSHLGKLIQDLIDVATLDQGEIDFLFEWCDLQDLVNFEVERMRASVPQEVDLIFADDCPQVRCDRALIGRVIRNLIDNAAKFTPSGDPIRIVISYDIDQVHVDVQDRGIGIDETEQENIFDRFYQVDSSLTRQAQGAGMGLNIARELVRLHRGEINVTSRLGKGSCFRISLPLDPDELNLATPLITERSA